MTEMNGEGRGSNCLAGLLLSPTANAMATPGGAD